jgi:acyl carrier protein
VIFERVKKILSEHFSVEEDFINAETDLVHDLGADSLDFADFVSSVSSEFDVDLELEGLENMRTVSDIVKHIEDLQDKKENKVND